MKIAIKFQNYFMKQEVERSGVKLKNFEMIKYNLTR